MKKLEAKVGEKSAFPLIFIFLLSASFIHLSLPCLHCHCCHQPYAGLPSTTKNANINFSPLARQAFFLFFSLNPSMVANSCRIMNVMAKYLTW
jgi:hypothetical protein